MKNKTAHYSEEMYDRDGKGSYMLYFKHDSKRLAIDATKEDKTFGRLINHAKDANVSMKVVSVARKPSVVFIALKSIEPGDEIQYDYGERRKAVVEANPWLA